MNSKHRKNVRLVLINEKYMITINLVIHSYTSHENCIGIHSAISTEI